MRSRVERVLRVVRHTWARCRPMRRVVVRPDIRPDGSRTVGVVVTVRDRPEYFGPMLEHLAHSALDRAIVAVVDDASRSAQVRHLCASWTPPGVPVVGIRRTVRRLFSVDEALRDGWDLLADEYGCTTLCNIDADTIMKPDWLERLVGVFMRERPRRGPLILTGFNSGAHADILEHGKDLVRKRTIGGVNMCFDVELYRTLVRHHLRYDPSTQVGWDWHVVNAMLERDYPLLCLRPSVIQHVGAHGQFSRPEQYDVAIDY